MVLMARRLSPACMKAWALIHTESQSRLGMVWITSIVMEATSAPFTDKDSSPGDRHKPRGHTISFPTKILALDKSRPRSTPTNDGVEGQGTLPQHLLVTGHCRAFLACLPVQIGQHHVDLVVLEETGKWQQLGPWASPDKWLLSAVWPQASLSSVYDYVA